MRAIKKKKDKKESLTNIVIKNSFYNFSATVINRFGALIFTIIVARVLLPRYFGIYNLAISIVFLLLTFTDLGINNSLIRYVSSSLAQRNIKKASAYFHYLIKLKFFLSISFSFILAILAYPISNFVFQKPDLFPPLIFSSLLLFFLSMDSFYSSLFFAFNKVKYINYKEILYQSLRLILLSLILFLIAKSYYILGVIFSLILSTLLVLIVILFWFKKIAPDIFKSYNFKINKKRVLKFIGYLAIGTLSVVFFSYIDIIMLGIFISDVSYIGFYRAAFSLVFSIAGLLTFASVLLPIFSRITKKRLDFSFNRVIKYTTILSIPATFGLFVLGKYFIRAIFGYEYLPAVIPLYFLAFVIIETTITSSYFALLTSKEKPGIYAKMLTIATILNFILNLTLISMLLKVSELWATTGAAIATLLSRYFYLIGLVYVTKKKLNLRIEKIHILKPLVASIIMSASLFIITLSVKDMNLLIGILEVLLGIIIYFVVMFLIRGIKKEDFNLIRNLFPHS